MQVSTTPAVQLLVKVAATGLVLSSAGFGAVYAFQSSAHGGKLLAGLAIVMALGLEVIKPFAIANAVTAFTSWSPIRGLALLLLGLVAVAYSLTSELSLMSASRGDLAAERAQLGKSQTIAQTAYERAQQELSTLKPSRPLSEISALVDFAKPVCRVLVTNAGRSTDCQKPGALVAELGRAKRRAELETVIAANGDKVSTGPALAGADPGSANLAVYLAALGFSIKPETIASWLSLIPVVALEVGSSLAGLLVAAVGHGGATVSHVQKASIPAPTATQKDTVASQIIGHLQANGGAVRGSQRKLASKLNTDRATVSRALHSLAASGLVAMASSKAGTVLKLAA